MPILKFWPNEFRISSVTHCPKFLLFRLFEKLAQNYIQNISLVPSFKPILQFLLMFGDMITI
jgi:hypothetical protein